MCRCKTILFHLGVHISTSLWKIKSTNGSSINFDVSDYLSQLKKSLQRVTPTISCSMNQQKLLVLEVTDERQDRCSLEEKSMQLNPPFTPFLLKLSHTKCISCCLQTTGKIFFRYALKKFPKLEKCLYQVSTSVLVPISIQTFLTFSFHRLGT